MVDPTLNAAPAWPDPRSDEILDIISRETGVTLDKLRADATIEELGIASLDLTQAVFELETHFNVEIPVLADRPAGAGAEFTTIGQLVGHVIKTIESSHALAAQAPA